MLDINGAKKILNYYGFVSDSVEPTLCQINGEIGIFATYKTKYGHLSRFKTFDKEETFKSFLAEYLLYRKNLGSIFTYVEFDDYEISNPNITFNIDKINNNTSTTKKIRKTVVDEKNENQRLLKIILQKAMDICLELNKIQDRVTVVLNDYKNKMREYNGLINNQKQEINIFVNKINVEEYEKKIEKIKQDFENDTNDNFVKYFEKSIKLLESIIDDKYIENYYLEQYYEQELNMLNSKIELYNDYQKYCAEVDKKNRKPKNKRIIMGFEEYLKENLKGDTIDKKEIINNKRIDFEKTLVELKNNSLNDLKLIYNIISSENNIEQKIDMIENKMLKQELNDYFLSLNTMERNIVLALSSPLKELINIIISIENDNKFEVVKSEEYYLRKFKELYNTLSSKDNYALTRRYLKLLKLDTLDEFINSVLEISNNLDIKKYSLPMNNILKFKMGIKLKEGFINSSIKNEFPVNNRGINDYYISSTEKTIKIMYSPYIIKLDYENNLIVSENDDVITFDMKGVELINNKVININDYMLKKTTNGEYKVSVFNNKKYIESEIQ